MRSGYLIFFIFVLSCSSVPIRAPSDSSCKVDDPSSCPSGQICIKLDSAGKTECRASYSEPDFIFQFPFDKNTEVVCTQSPQNPEGSHSFSNSLYAIDLTTPYDRPASIIRASADGKAFVFNDCKTPQGYPSHASTDNCGLGWGNHVRILHKDGVVSFYVHFKKIIIKDGDQVKAGQPLGIEGWTGLAGHRHLHWDVHKLSGSTVAEWEKTLSNPGWGGLSIPYFFEVNINGKNKIISSRDVQCRHDNMTQVYWRGTK